MKYILIVLVICLRSAALFAQEPAQEIPAELKKQLLEKIIPQVRSFVEKWGTYRPGTTITEVNQLDQNTVEIRGKVNYEGELCGDVNTDYKVTITTEADNQDFKICVYCPFCFLGSVVKREWDCKGVKYMGAKDYIQIIDKIGAANNKQ